MYTLWALSDQMKWVMRGSLSPYGEILGALQLHRMSAGYKAA